MTKFFLLLIIPATTYLMRCSRASNYKFIEKRTFETVTSTPFTPPENETLFEISTDFGIMKCRLFNETPLHRDNFIKLIQTNYFDSLLFHRVIKNFVIQGGDPDSKNAKQGVLLGDGGPGYTIPAEFMPQKYFHKKGALAAARDGDDVNPKKESSGSQFYIVQGKIHDDASLLKNEKRINRPLIQKLSDSILSLPKYKNLKASVERLKLAQNKADSLSYFQKKIDSLTEPLYLKSDRYKIPEAQRTLYKHIGGTPHLDSHYTVFGEVYEGLDVLDKIIALETDKNDRPTKDVRMKVRITKTPK
ncbi:MAG: peptidylprolyl isomerase [Bacteroidota bacterium]|jgi:peptidylprolyl isomerase